MERCTKIKQHKNEFTMKVQLGPNVVLLILQQSAAATVCDNFPRLMLVLNSLYLFLHKQIGLVTPHIENIGGRVFSSMTSSLLNKLPAIVKGTDTVSVFIV